MDFHDRLEKAIQRGRRAGDAEARARAERALGEEELKRLHTQYRLELSEHIEVYLRELTQQFPGFRFETRVGTDGWGGSVSRDNLALSAGKRETHFSRLELAVKPFTAAHVLELVAKGTIRNKEVYNRNQYQLLSHVDMASFRELVDRWILEYAELYAAKG